jgi:hypothetical protein
VNAQQLIDPASKPAGVETIGLFGPLRRASCGIVFSGPLESGNYALVCYLTDANSVPYSRLGMLRGFTVSKQRGWSVRQRSRLYHGGASMLMPSR